jgi:hypothetical protein
MGYSTKKVYLMKSRRMNQVFMFRNFAEPINKFCFLTILDRVGCFPRVYSSMIENPEECLPREFTSDDSFVTVTSIETWRENAHSLLPQFDAETFSVSTSEGSQSLDWDDEY